MTTPQKTASTPAALDLILKGLSDARLEAHGLNLFWQRVRRLVESSPEDVQERIYEQAGDMLQGAPDRFARLQAHLDRTSFALSKMTQKSLGDALSIQDKARLTEAFENRVAARRLASRFLAAAEISIAPNPAPYNNLPSPGPRQDDAQEAMRIREDVNPHDTIRHLPQPSFRLSGWGFPEQEGPGPRTRPVPEKDLREQASFLDQGATVHQRRPGIAASAYDPQARYYRVTSRDSISTIMNRWQKDRQDAHGVILPRQKVYDDSMPVWFAAKALWPFREYTWTPDTARSGHAVVNGQRVHLTGEQKWSALQEDLKERGWDPQEPLYFQIGREGGAKVGEGNHRLALAYELGLKVPVVFSFESGVVRKSPPSRPEPVKVKVKPPEPLQSSEPRSPEDDARIDDLLNLLKMGATQFYYHATPSMFAQVDHDRSGLGTHFGSLRSARDRVRQKRWGDARILKVQVMARNPLKMSDVGGWDDPSQVMFGLTLAKILSTSLVPEFRKAQKEGAASAWSWLRGQINALGYDSILYKNVVEDPGKWSYIIWDDGLLKYAGPVDKLGSAVMMDAPEIGFLYMGQPAVLLGVCPDSGAVQIEVDGEADLVPIESFFDNTLFLEEADIDLAFDYFDAAYEDSDADLEEDLGHVAAAPQVNLRHTPKTRQHKQRGQDKQKSRMNYRKNRQKNKTRARQRYNKVKKNPKFKKQQQIRRKNPNKFKRKVGRVAVVHRMASLHLKLAGFYRKEEPAQPQLSEPE